MFFFKNHAENEAGKIVSDLFLIYKKALYEVKVINRTSVSISFDSPELDISKTKLYKKTLNY